MKPSGQGWKIGIDADLLSLGVFAGAASGLKPFTATMMAQGYLHQGLWRLSAIELQDNLEHCMALGVAVVGIPALLSALLRRGFGDNRRELRSYAASVLPAITFLLLGQWVFDVSSSSVGLSFRGTAGCATLVVAALLIGWRLTRPPQIARRVLRSSAIITVVLIATLHLGLFAQERLDGTPGPNIILVYFDALRADHLSSYGYSRPTSPNVDRLAREGVLFRNVTSQASSTYPSVASVLTSKYGSEFFDSAVYDLLAEQHLTLAELLRDRGYHTAGFSSSAFITARRPKSLFGGYEQGFEVFDDSVAFGRETNWQWRGSEAVVDKALRWLDRRPQGKFFLFVYIIDPHDPYHPPPPYDRMYDPGYRGKEPVERGECGIYDGLITRGFDPALDVADIQHLAALYDGEINYADAQLGRLLERVSAAGLTDDTIIVFTSDHGEEVYEHGGLRHRLTLYQEVLHVPLIVRYPPAAPRGVVVDRPFIESLDIAPTILSFAGIDSPPEFRGRSLLPLITNPHSDWRDYALSETVSSEAKAILRGKWKYIHHFELSRLEHDLAPRYRSGTELYDLEADPGEHKNILSEHPDVASGLHAKMLALLPEVERHRLGSRNAHELDESIREQLKSLGYLH